MKYGLVVEVIICKFVDWLLFIYNLNNLEENNWIKFVIYLCKKKYVDVNIIDIDYEDFLILFKDIFIVVLYIV